MGNYAWGAMFKQQQYKRMMVRLRGIIAIANEALLVIDKNIDRQLAGVK